MMRYEMRLWPFAAITACSVIVLVLGGCGAGGGEPALFDASVADSARPITNGDGSTIITTNGDGGPNGCVPKTCSDQHISCGMAGDTCGNEINCWPDGGACADGGTCGGGGTPNECGSPACTPETCANYPDLCGVQADHCGGLTPYCNPCDAGEICGGGGTSKCGTGVIPDGGVTDGAACTPQTCQPNQCGWTNDGCGNALNCNACPDGGTCGAPTPFFCGYPAPGALDGGCVPSTCASQGFSCGFAGDGCGNIINCWPDAGGMDAGTCPDYLVCGGAGVPGVCGDAGALLPDGGTITCVPSGSCAGLNCGFISDGCGHAISCWPDGGSPDSGAACPGDGVCGASGDPNVCGPNALLPDGGAPCSPLSCAAEHIGCGMAGDGCGNIINCWPDGGVCPNFTVCGAVTPGECGDAGAKAPDGGPILCFPSKACGGLNCGYIDDGCGNAISCWPDGGSPDSGAACPSDGVCGVPTPNVCGASPLGPDGGIICHAQSCASQGLGCGMAGDGCGNVINCWPDGGVCPNYTVCGAVTPGECGDAGAKTPDGGPILCFPSKTCAGLNCGFIDDGCGDVISCWPDGGSPDSGASCAGDGVCGVPTPNVCGASPLAPDGGIICHALTCATQNIFCGPAGDGCGNLLNCYPDGGSSCSSGSTCNSVDGGPLECLASSSVCTKLTCAGQGVGCGSAGDGCGGELNCYPGDASSCGDGSSCEGTDAGTIECVDHPAACIPATCGGLGYNCGVVGNGCGTTINCNGTGDAGCVAPEFCGGGGPNLCGFGFSPPGDAGAYVACSSGTTTSIRGFAYAATNPAMFTTTVTPDPLAGAYVWVPNNGQLPAITPGVSCEQCSDPPTALAVAITGADGGFILPSVPVVATSGTATVPIIVQVGRWAKLTTVDVTPCEANTITGYNLRLPRTGAEGNMPWFAVDTGELDSLECVLLKMGIDPSMFASPATVLSDMDAGTPSVAGGTRVAIYTSPDTIPTNNHGGTEALGGAIAPDNTTTSGANLYTSAPTLDRFDAVLFPCVGAEVDKAFAGAQENVVNYANSGGRVFATHYSYVWLMDVYPQAVTALGGTPSAYAWGCTTDDYAWAWYGSPYNSEEYVGTDTVCDTTGQTVGQWDLQQGMWDAAVGFVDTTTSSGQEFGQWMVDLSAASLSGTTGPGGTVTSGSVVQFPIDMARWDLDSVIPAVAQQWVYLDAGTTHAVQQMTFNTPVNADAGAQCGKVVFSDFHVTNNAVGEVRFPTECTANAGTTVTGELVPLTPQERALEYMLFNLTSCVQQKTTGSCTPLTCAAQGIGCGLAGDGCGNQINCWPDGGTACPTGTCGGGGVPNVCGSACVPKTCANYPYACGDQTDGCGGILTNCYTCPGTTTCGGGGTPNTCGTCVPKTCSDYIMSSGLPACGDQADGCGNMIPCGTCTAPATCGGAGTPDVCGVPDGGVCAPKTCSDYSGLCGQQSDGCGGLTTVCNPCTTPATCGGGGTPNVCGFTDAAVCTPTTCTSGCGYASNGCGGVSPCPACPTGETCGGSGAPDVCGVPDGGVCVKLTCSSPVYASVCGVQSDDCGGLTANCNPCPTGTSCGGGGTAGVCGTTDATVCTPQVCTSGCGSASDGCGGVSPCPPCPTGETCGGSGTPNVCGMPDAGSCAPLTCSSPAYAGLCGVESDGCGGLTANCNPCTIAGQSCGGGGTPGVCGGADASVCVPRTCADYPSVCGEQSDGCGGITAYCNPCTVAGQTCGGAGTPGVCASGACNPTTCAAQGIQCGPAGDGCGGALSCGTCPTGQTCGGGGTPGVCGGCVKLTCSSTGVGCGQNGDGCGGEIDCPCPSGQTCGGGGTPGVCGVACTPTTCSALQVQCGYAADGCGNSLTCGTCPTNQNCVKGVCTGTVPQ